MIVFDPATKRIVLDVTEITATEIWSRWIDWAATDDNAKYLPAMSQVGGDDLGGSLSIPFYFFLLNGWRVRPKEADHTLIITGNLFVEGGGVPVVPTLGTYNVSVQYTVPVQAQGISTSGGSGGLTVGQAATLEEILAKVAEVFRIQGLNPADPLMVSTTARQAGSITQTITKVGDVTTVQRV